MEAVQKRPKKPTPKATARERFREYALDLADHQRPSVKLPEITKQAIEHFRKEEPAVLVELAKDELYMLCYQIVQGATSEGRSVDLGNGEVVHSLDAARQVLNNRGKSIFDRWLEHVGDRHVYLKELDRTLLALAVQQRHGRIEAETSKFRFLGMISQNLPKDKKVGEHYSDVDLHAIWERANHNRIDKAS